MAYAEPSSTTTAEARTLGLGLRARWRAAREARMVSPRARRRLAEDLEEAVFRAERPTAPFSAVVPVSLEPGELRHADRRALRALDRRSVTD